LSGIAAAQARSDRVDSQVVELSARLSAVSDSVAVVALGAYGRRELTPHGEVDLLFLHHGELATRWVTEAICYPLWERDVRVEPVVRTLAECTADARRSWSAATSFLDARLIAGDLATFADFERQVVQPWRRDRERLRHRLRTDAARRHATHTAATTSAAPDLTSGRGGLIDVLALRWLGIGRSERLTTALDFLLRALSTPDAASGDAFLRELYGHARWVAFTLDGALAPPRDDRQVGTSLSVRRGKLVADRLPPLERAPALGLRVATLVGLAPPDELLMAWAATPGPPLAWDEPTRAQFWLLLRAADWRAWDFLDVSGLLLRYLPEWDSIWRTRGSSAADELSLDSHSIQAVRRLHEWTESGDPLAERAWRPLRRRDWLYLSVLLHELTPSAATAAAGRLGIPEEAVETLAFVVENYRLLADTATRRDLHDEDLLVELAARIRTRQRLSLLFLVAAAHDLASAAAAWTPWKADLMRQLFTKLEAILRQGGEVGSRRTRTVEQHRERITRELERRNMHSLLPLVPRLPRRYVLTRSPAFVARHLGLLQDAPLADGEVRLQAFRHRQPGWWDVLIVARDRPGLLATVAGVITMRGASTLAADAATCADGLVFDVFTVSGAFGQPLERERWPAIAADVQAALNGRIPLGDLLGARPLPAEEAEAIHVSIDNAASQFFSVVEVRAPDQVGLLYRIADGLHDLGLDIHHARIATHPDGVVDVFYVWDLAGEKLDKQAAFRAATALTARLRGEPAAGVR
jgi:[protein-PII] uridylyltransferase